MSTSLAEFAWEAISSAFTGESAFISDSQWNVATIMTNKIAALMSVVAVGVAIFAMLRAALGGKPKAYIVKAFLAALLAWPFTAVAVWLVIKASGFFDKLTNVMFGDTDGKSLESLVAPLVKGTMEPNLTGGWVALLIVMLLFAIGGLIIAFVMIFRNFGLLVLIAFAPVALMLVPEETTRQWAKLWGQGVLALLLAKPLAAGILILAAELVGAAEGFAQSLTAIVGLFIAAFSPAATMQLVSFTGANSVNSDSQAAAQGAKAPGQNVMQAMRVASSAKSWVPTGRGRSSRAPAPSGGGGINTAKSMPAMSTSKPSSSSSNTTAPIPAKGSNSPQPGVSSSQQPSTSSVKTGSTSGTNNQKPSSSQVPEKTGPSSSTSTGSQQVSTRPPSAPRWNEAQKHAPTSQPKTGPVDAPAPQPGTQLQPAPQVAANEPLHAAGQPAKSPAPAPAPKVASDSASSLITHGASVDERTSAHSSVSVARTRKDRR